MIGSLYRKHIVDRYRLLPLEGKRTDLIIRFVMVVHRARSISHFLDTAPPDTIKLLDKMLDEHDLDKVFKMAHRETGGELHKLPTMMNSL